jgi:alkaline phosphatase D
MYRAVLLTLTCATLLLAQPMEFPTGIASGQATHASVVLWTRTSAPATVVLEVATNPEFDPLYQSHNFESAAESDFVVKPNIYGLLANTRYYYRFRAGETLTETGSFRTAPLPWDARSVRFAFSGDSDATKVDGQPAHGPLKVLDAIRAENPAFFIYLGDIIYSYSGFRGSGPATPLDEYRATYQENREDKALRELSRSTSFLSVWDDHEVENDWDPATVDPQKFAIGLRAFLEQLPVTPPTMPMDEGCIAQPMFRYFRWGSAVDLIVLDERSCRSEAVDVACRHEDGTLDPAPLLPALIRRLGDLGPPPPAGCAEALNDPGRTMIGPTQKWLLKNYLRYSTAKFKFIVNEVGILQYFVLPYDRWEGYAAERREILEFIRDNKIENVIFLTADAHANVIADVAIDIFTDDEAVATEFITGPIATNTLEKSVEAATGITGDVLNEFVGYLDVACWDLDVFAYGLVDVDLATGATTVSLKDENGEILKSKGDPNVLCTKTVGR